MKEHYLDADNKEEWKPKTVTGEELYLENSTVL